MSAATVFPQILQTNLQNLAFAMLTSIRYGSGVAATGFIDRLGNPVSANWQAEAAGTNTQSQAGPAREVQIQIRINPDGQTATCKVIAQTPNGLQSVEGQLDPTLFAGTTL